MARFKSRSENMSPAQRITAQIISRLEQGTKPWIRPWRGVPVSRPLRACGLAYRGMNTFWLWMMAEMAGYGPALAHPFRCQGFAPRRGHAAVRSLYRMCLSLRHAGQRDPSHEAGMLVYYQSRRRYDLAASHQVHCLQGHVTPPDKST